MAVPVPKRPSKKPTRKDLEHELLKQNTTSEEFLELGLNGVGMAIREEAMSYFKGSCVNRFVFGVGVKAVRKPFESGENGERYQYMRRQHDIENPTYIRFNGETLGLMRHDEDRMTFYTHQWRRSEEMLHLYECVQEFFGKYLGGVLITTEPGKNPGPVDDRTSFIEIGRKMLAREDETSGVFDFDQYRQYIYDLQERMAPATSWGRQTITLNTQQYAQGMVGDAATPSPGLVFTGSRVSSDGCDCPDCRGDEPLAF